MVIGDALLKRHVAEHFILAVIITAHCFSKLFGLELRIHRTNQNNDELLRFFSSLLVTGSKFLSAKQQHFAISGVAFFQSIQCEISDGAVGVLTGGASCELIGLTVLDTESGLGISGGANVRLQDCVFAPQKNICLLIPDSGSVEIDSCYLSGGHGGFDDISTISISSATSFSMTNSSIIRGGEWAIRSSIENLDGTPINVRNNWWGTTDTDLIDTWIRDDDEDARVPPELTAFPYLPILNQEPVDTERKSFGALKAGEK